MTVAARRKILITGATSGIGLALAQRLAPHHDLLLTGRRPADALGDDRGSILLPGVSYVQADQTRPEAAATQILRALRKARVEALDYAVLNAGTGFVVTGLPETADQIRATMDANLAFAIVAARRLFPLLAKDRGLLTLVGSTSHRGSPLAPAYAASKAGLHGLARSLRAEWRGRVDVQVVHPGPTRTGMHEKAGHDPGWLMNLFLEPADIASMIASAMVWRRSPVTVGWLRYFGGGTIKTRRL